MASRVTAKKIPTRRQSALSQSSAGTGVGGNNDSPTPTVRAASPLSPTRHSRIAEKVELQNLNDRLACYIDRVRYLESENARLTVEVQTSRDSVTREVTNIKQMYELELQDARKLLDETAREKARLEIDTKRLWEENEELKASLDKKTKDHAQAENTARMYETRSMDLSNKYNSVCSDRKKLQDDARNNAELIEKLRRQLDDLRKLLETETLARVDLENTVQSLREELSFRENVHSQELSETRSRRQVEISEIDGRLSDEYEAKLQQSLKELRDQYENQMRSNREEIETLYDSKMKNLSNAAARAARTTVGLTEELRMVRSRSESLNGRIVALEKLNSQLEARIRELETELDGNRVRRLDDEAELARLRQEMEQQLQEYQDLMDIKVSLDLEIAAYDKLLCGEEQRLNITPLNASGASTSQSFSRETTATIGGGRSATPGSAIVSGRRPPSRASIGPAAKRKRTVVEESEERSLSDYSVTASAKGDVEIADVCSAGRYVKLANKSNKEVNIGGWQVVRSAGGNNSTNFKFHRSVKLDAGASVTVWSADTDRAIHDPPGNIVMKTQKWFVSDNMKTSLINGAGDEVAASERVRHNISSHASRHREAYGDESQLQRSDRAGSSGSAVGRILANFW